ncbi:MAG: glycosyltransferase [Nitrospinota bacterium]
MERNFDAVTFSVSRHMRRFDAGARDLVVECIGVDPHDRLYPGSQRVKGSHSLWFSRIQKDLLEAIGKANDERSIDLVFIYGGYGQIAPETLRSIRSLGIPIAILSLDDKHSFLGNRRGGPYGREGLVNSYDVHLTNSLECVRWYVSEGVPAFYFPQGIDPELCEPVDGPRDIEVSFVGQAYGFRLRFIKSLRRAGIPVQCFGRGWENGTVEDQFDLYRRSRINLGIGATGLMERMTCIKARDFEVPASGTLYITTYDHELANLFIIGKEILCYRNDVDCVELLRFYLQNPEEAEHIACAGRARCLAAHTWTHRMVSVLKWMGILVS